MQGPIEHAGVAAEIARTAVLAGGRLAGTAVQAGRAERLCGLTAVYFLKEVEGLVAKPQVALSQLEGFPKNEHPVSPHGRRPGPHGRAGRSSVPPFG